MQLEQHFIQLLTKVLFLTTMSTAVAPKWAQAPLTTSAESVLSLRARQHSFEPGSDCDTRYTSIDSRAVMSSLLGDRGEEVCLLVAHYAVKYAMAGFEHVTLRREAVSRFYSVGGVGSTCCTTRSYPR